jgi:hypothetical protein
MAGFWQQVLKEESRQFTAFTVPGRGTRYQLRVTPMGLQGSPASFSRLMEYVMRGVAGVLTYIDDVLVHTPNHDDHLTQLEEVFLRLRKYGLKLNMDKTIFGATNVQYLGYTLDEEDISPIHRQVGSRTRHTTTNQPEADERVCRTVQLLQVPHPELLQIISSNDGPHEEGCGLDGEDAGTGDGEFHQTQRATVLQASIAYPNREGMFYLYTDGALGEKDYPGGLGLSSSRKKEDDCERVVAYASRDLKDHEKNYSAFLLELAAAVYGIDHFDVYLKGRQFVLCTDHKPLEKLSAV